LDELSRLFRFGDCVSEFRYENRFQFFEDWRRNDQVSQASLKGEEATIRCSAPEESGNQDVGVQNHPHLRRLMQEIVNQPLAIFFGQAGEIQPALSADRFNAITIASHEAIKRVKSAN